MANETRRHFDDRYPAPKPAVHLAEFEADIAAADNDEMPRQKIDVHHRRIRQVGHFGYAGHRRHQRPAADIDKDPFSPQPLAGDFHHLRRCEPGMATVSVMFAAFSRAEVRPFRDAATIASLRALTRRMSMPTSPPITTPYSAARRAVRAA